MLDSRHADKALTRSPDAQARSASFGTHGASLAPPRSGIDALDRLAQSGTRPVGLPAALRAAVQTLSGLDMAGVRVHLDSSRPAVIGALAYAQGNDIYLGPGQQAHLPHEAWHVVQQMQGRATAGVQARGLPLNDDAGLEHEADAMGALAVALPYRASAVACAKGGLPVPTRRSSGSRRPSSRPIQRPFWVATC